MAVAVGLEAAEAPAVVASAPAAAVEAVAGLAAWAAVRAAGCRALGST